MTTAELIKKREEDKNKPQTTSTSSASGGNPFEGMDMAEARMAGNNMPQAETSTSTATAEQGGNPYAGKSMAEARMMGGSESGVSLYDDGANSGNKTVISGSPINTPEYQHMREQLIRPEDFGVETEEQRKKRERADFIKQGLTGFTEGLSALANLYYTTKGAPSQKLASQMPALQKRLYEERLERDRKLENFRAWVRDKARRDDEMAYQDAIRKEQTDEDRRRWEYTTKKQEEATAKADARYEAEKAYAREQDERDYNERVRHNKAVEANSASRTSGSKSGNGRLLRIQRPNGEPMVFRKDDLENGVNLAYIYNSLPDEYKVRDTNSNPVNEKGEVDFKNGKHPISKNPTKFEMMTAIGSALQAGAIEEMAEDIQVGAANPIHSNGQQGSGQDSKGQEQNGNSGSKWDAYDVTGGGTDFSKQKRPRQQGTATKYTSSQMSNVAPSSVPRTPSTQQASTDSGGNQFEAFFNRVDTARAEEKVKKDAELQADIRNREAELAGVRDTINQYEQELERLNKMSVPNAEQEIKKRGLTGSDAKELRDMVKDYVNNKERIKKELKELIAKEKRLNKEYAELYPYKK